MFRWGKLEGRYRQDIRSNTWQKQEKKQSLQKALTDKTYFASLTSSAGKMRFYYMVPSVRTDVGWLNDFSRKGMDLVCNLVPP